jgi:hypothetical protein
MQFGRRPPFELPSPLGRRIAKTLDANAGGRRPSTAAFDEGRREEGERDGHVDLTNAALLPIGDLFWMCDWP